MMNDTLTYWSLTDCAECFSGIDDALRSKLWSFHDDDASPEFSEVPDNFCNYDGNSVAAHWHKFTPSEQAALNAAEDRYPE